MLGVINPNSSESLQTQKDLAKQADYMLLPGEQFPTEKEQMSLSKLAHTATETQTVTTGATPAPAASSIAPHPHPDDDDDDGGSSGLSTGAVTGIAVGAAVVALVVVALFILMRRTKKLKKKLEDEKASTAARHRSEANPMSPNLYGNYYDQNRPHSHLPPYQQHQTADAYMHDPNKPEGWNGQQSPGRTMSPPVPGQQYMGVPSPDPNQRYR